MLYINKAFIKNSRIYNSSIFKNLSGGHSQNKFNKLLTKSFTSDTTTENKIKEEESHITQLKQLSEFKSGLNSLAEGKLQDAEYHLKECNRLKLKRIYF